MRKVISKTVSVMSAPDAVARNEASIAEPTQANHTSYLNTWECLQTIESVAPPFELSKPRALTIGAWNIERCKRVEESADLLRTAGVDIILATEMDVGMARSSQRHTTKDLAAELGFGYVYGVEYVELGTGDPYETGLFSEIPNELGLHGNAIISKYPLLNPRLIPLNDSGLWYSGAPKADGQRRVGGRMAIAAQIECVFGPLVLVAVHFESESDAFERKAQAITLLDGIEESYDSDAVVIGGDLNTADLSGQSIETCLFRPQEHECCFSIFEEFGFTWQTSNNGAPTTRAAPGKPVKYPLMRLDWLFARDVSAHNPLVYPAVSNTGHYLSDHELLTVRIGS